MNNKYRDMHIKLFITLSDDKESDNALVFGGRNIHDGFLFEELPDHSRFPNSSSTEQDDDFVHWNDFEAKITSKELAESAAAHVQRFLDRDKPRRKCARSWKPGTRSAEGRLVPPLHLGSVRRRSRA